jgi:ribonuclease E
MSKDMLINTTEGHECRIAIIADGRLEELYTERASSASQVGNIYYGKVTNIEPSIQAAFIDFGGSKNGFLHISDVHPQYFPKGKKSTEKVGRRTAHKTRPPIQDCLRRGQEIVVQMTKQGIGTKGPTLTTYLSIPGRLLVTMPGMKHVGISRKIEDEDDRGKLRKTLEKLNVPDDMGVIVRTAGIGRSQRDLQRDLSYLMRLWKVIWDKVEQSRAPEEIYQESDLVIRTIRDVFDSDVKRIICDSQDVAERVKDFLDVAVPRAKCQIRVYQGNRGLFEEFGVEQELEQIHSRVVELKSGGSLVIDQTEALVAIDVNSGSFRAHSDAETNALKLNLEAAREIGRQLRLRDLGGVLVIDFVDMRQEKNRRNVEREMREILKTDRAKSKALRLSSFGLMEITRQRLRASLKQHVYSRCEQCDGTGLVMSPESAALAVMRKISAACANDDVLSMDVRLSPEIALFLLNVQRKHLAELEQKTDTKIRVQADDALTQNDIAITCKNNRGAEIAWDTSNRSAKSAEPDTIELGKLRRKRRSDQKAQQDSSSDQTQGGGDSKQDQAAEDEGKPKKRRRRGRRSRKKSDESQKQSGQEQSNATENSDQNKNDTNKSEKDRASGGQQDERNSQPNSSDEKNSKEESGRKPRRRRRSKSKSGGEDSKADSAGKDSSQPDRGPSSRKSDSNRKDSGRGDSSDANNTKSESSQDNASKERKDSSDDSSQSGDAKNSSSKKRRRGRRGGRRHKKKTSNENANEKADSNTESKQDHDKQNES